MNPDATDLRRISALIFRRSLFIAIPVATIIGLTAGAYAAIQKFTAGGKLSAAELNGNFTDLDGRVGSLESKVVVKRNGKLYSVGATYCGSTAKVLNGQITNGYAGLKSLCESLAACGPSSSAHACSGEELSRTRQMGIVVTTAGSYVSGAYSLASGGVMRDCVAWSSASASEFNLTWDANGPSGLAACNDGQPILCCD